MAKKPPKVPGWKLVWHDEFEGSEIDRSKWDYDMGNGFYDYKNHAWVPGWGNEELQYYTDSPANARMLDGSLTISAQGIAARLRLHIGSAENASSRRHAAVHHAVRPC